MCIRDRGGEVFAGGVFGRRQGGRGGVDGARQHDREGGAGAVSYTHLRAHETVLDLVCRLLLEKKN